MPIYKSPSGKTIDIPEAIDTATGKDKARDEAMAKGWKPQVEMVSAKSGKNIYVDQDGLDEAKQKGWLPKHEYDASKVKVQGLTPGKSAALGATQAGTMGFADELYGAAKGLAGKLKKQDYLPTYQKARDEARGVYQAAEQQSPGAYLGGSLAGGFLTPGGTAKSLAGMVGKGAATGAAMGLGSSEADLTKGKFKDAARDVGASAAIGGGLGAAGRALDVAPAALKGKALNEAHRSLRLTDKELSRLSPQQQKSMAESALDYLGPTGTLKAGKLEEDLSSAGRKVGSANEALASAYGDAKLKIDDIVKSLRQKADEAGFSGAKENLSSAYNKVANLFERRAPQDTIGDRVKRIREFGDAAYGNKGLIASDAAQKQVQGDVRNILKDDMISQIESRGGKKAVEELKAADRDYSRLAKLDEVSPRILKREELEGGLSRITGGTLLGGLGGLGVASGDYTGAATGASTGSALGLLGHLAMKRKNPLAAYYSNKASQILGSKTGQQFADRLESAAQKGLVPFMLEIDKVSPRD